MFALPSLPTENLYKFFALGGIVMVITSSLYLVSERQKVGVDIIKLNTKKSIYNSKIERYNKKVNENLQAYKMDTLRLNKLLKKVISDKRQISNHGTNNLTYEWVNGEKRSINEYEKFLSTQLDSTVSIFNRNLSIEQERNEDAYLDKIKLDEQSNLINNSISYLMFVGLEVIMIGGLGIWCLLWGFIKWRESQNISDELIKIQLAKAKKELEGL